MKKLNYLLSTSGKFHYFNIAKVLYRRNQLNKIVCGYPWVKLKIEKIPKNYIDNFSFYNIANHFLHKQSYVNANKLIDNFDILTKKKIDKLCSKHLDNTDIFISSTQNGVETGKKIKEKNKIYICDQVSANIFFENNLMDEEYKLFNQKRFFRDNWFADTAAQEYENSNLISVPSNYVKSTFDLKYQEKIFVNNFGINTNNFYPLHEKNKKKKFFDIVYIGSISIKKGIHYLIDAFNNFKHPYKRLHLIGSHVAVDVNFFKKKLNNEKIIVYGHVDNLKLNKILNECDVFAIATLTEGYAMVINQAAASGCPVIVTENSGAKEFVEENNCGFVVPIRDSKSISDKFSTLSDDKDLLQKLSNNAVNASKDNSWENYCDRMENLINAF